MKEIRKHIQQDIIIESDTSLYGNISGNVIVSPGINFIVHGMISGNVTLDRESSMIIYGSIGGDIINSGKCEIWGMVNGKLIEADGIFIVDPEAVIHENI